MQVKKLATLLVVIALVVGCAGMTIKPPDILYQAESIYNAQHDDYMSFFSYNAMVQSYVLRPDVPNEMIPTLQLRKQILDDFEKAIKAYRVFVKANETPSYEVEQELIGFIRAFQYEANKRIRGGS